MLDENFEEPLRRRRGERELIEELQAKARHRTEDIKRVINDFVDGSVCCAGLALGGPANWRSPTRRFCATGRTSASF